MSGVIVLALERAIAPRAAQERAADRLFNDTEQERVHDLSDNYRRKFAKAVLARRAREAVGALAPTRK